MKFIKALPTLCVLLLPCALRAESFEGKVSMKITSDSKDTPQSMDYLLKEGFVRMNIATERGAMGMILDLKNRQMIMLMPPQRMYMVRPFGDAANPAGGPAGDRAPANDSEIQVTSTKETILGYECTKVVVTRGSETSEIWVTSELGTFMGMSPGGGGMGRRPQVPKGWELALKGKGWFPMRVVSLESGKEKFRLEVTAVQKESEPDSQFAPPDGWTKFDLGSIMGGGGRMPFGNN